MAIEYIAGSAGTNTDLVTTDTTINVTLGAAIPVGSTIVLSNTTSVATGGQVTSVTDDAGNIYSQRAEHTGATVEIWSTDASASIGSPTTITVNYKTGNEIIVVAAAYLGVRSLGISVSSASTNGTPGSFLTSQDNNNWQVGAIASLVSNSAFTVSAGNQRGNNFNGAGHVSILVGDQTSVSPALITFSGTCTSELWGSVGLELRTVDPVAKINFYTLTANGSTSAVTSPATDPITPLPNALVLVAVGNSVGSGSPATPTLAGNSLTYVQIATETFGTVASPLRRVTLFRAMGAAPTSGAITISFGVSQTTANWTVVQFTNVNTTGTNGSGAIVQSAVNNADSAATLTVTLSAFASTQNMAFGAFGAPVAQTICGGAGFCQIAGWAGETNDLGTIGMDNQTAVLGQGTGSQTRNWGGIAVEIAPALPASKARQFNGTSDKLASTLPSPSYFNSTSIIPLTIAFWFKSRDTTQVQRYIAGFNGETAIIYGYATSGGLDQIEFYDAAHFVGTNPRTGSQITISDTNWHHVVYRYTGNGGAGEWAYFLDGVKTVINASCSIGIGTSADTGFNMGVGWSGTTNFLIGSLARFIFSNNTAFTDAQIIALATTGDISNITGVTGYWLLDGNNSPEPESLPSPNSNSLTVTGTTQVEGPVLSSTMFDMTPGSCIIWVDD